MSEYSHLPDGLERLSDIRESIGRRKTLFFLDFDGTLAPISPTPDAACMPAHLRELLERLARATLVCIVSGRGLTDLQAKVGVNSLYYAADHGHRITGPQGSNVELEIAPDDTLELENASYELEQRLRHVQGAIIETKGVSLSIHYRLVGDNERMFVEQVVKEIAAASPGLRLTSGKQVFELTPDLGWNKGKAMLWLIKRLGYRRSSVCPICVGDDLTDEDMFAAAHGWGIGLVVGRAERETRADYELRDPAAVSAFLEAFVQQPRYAVRPKG